MKRFSVLLNIQQEVAKRVTDELNLKDGTIILAGIDKVTSLESGKVLSYLLNFRINGNGYRIEISKSAYLKREIYIDLMIREFIKNIERCEGL